MEQIPHQQYNLYLKECALCNITVEGDFAMGISHEIRLTVLGDLHNMYVYLISPMLHAKPFDYRIFVK